MTSQKAVVVIPGVIRGQGHQRNCKIKAIKVTMPGVPGATDYVDWEVIDSDNLPDGDYDITVGSKTVPSTRKGHYLSRQP